MKTLNYKYAIFPTKPQKRHLSRQMKECRIQWNRAVKTRRRLKGSLQCYKVGVVLCEVLSIQKGNTQGQRAKALARLQETVTDVSTKDLPVLYDLRKVFGKVFEISPEHLDLALLADAIQPLLREELTAHREYWRLPEDKRGKTPPKRPIYFKLLAAVSDFAGLEAQRYMKSAFWSPKISRSTIRFTVSGSQGKSRFENACAPSPEQRRIGNPG